MQQRNKKEVNMMKWTKNIIYTYKLTLETGLHIGGIKDTVQIGGTDSPVYKSYKRYDGYDKALKVPVIPGSSIKGKIRSLLELKDNRTSDGKPCQCGTCLICKLFGFGANTDIKEFNHSRLVFRDASPTSDTIKEWDKNEDIIEGGEVKGENNLNRITSHATPRFIERVPAGSEFELEIILSIYDDDNENDLKKKFEEGISLLEDSYIGGSGSRGYGKIKLTPVGEPIVKDEKAYESE